ncbi:hypothetical protein Q8A67_024880 [Cirrhinus molitorella]|uniref:Uncharacterized protein n=1 Tax=Cirrhinus molitorella TaxID=172907 RepID=A0AA88PD94_9TELE|nr:hypothetical protein Q8A67_024880 [Cirrhinus molitorella]
MQIESFKLNFRENARSRTDHGADIIAWPVSGDSPVHPHLLRSSVSLNDSLATAGIPRSHTTPALLSSQEQEGDAGSLTGLRTHETPRIRTENSAHSVKRSSRRRRGREEGLRRKIHL